jgi:hypothetical protein
MHWRLLWFRTSANLQKIKEFLKVLIAFASHHLIRDLVALLQGWTQSALKIAAIASPDYIEICKCVGFHPTLKLRLSFAGLVFGLSQLHAIMSCMSTSVRRINTFEPELDPAELLKLDLLADELEISRLKAMGVLISAESYDVAGQMPKKLTTRIVRTWRDKHLNGEHVWLRRSPYVAIHL